MSRLIWDGEGSRSYNAGLDRGVLYPSVEPGVAWAGLISLEESSEDVQEFDVYVDGQKANRGKSSGAFSANLTAYTYPTEFGDYSGAYRLGRNRNNSEFGLSWRVMVGPGDDYEIHLLYSAKASPTGLTHKTFGGSSDAETMSWSISTRPIIFNSMSISHLIIGSYDLRPGALAELEETLYGGFITDPRLPDIQDILDIVEKHAIFKVTDNGDGTATISGPDDAVYALDATTWRLDWSSVVQIVGETYRLSSL